MSEPEQKVHVLSPAEEATWFALEVGRDHAQTIAELRAKTHLSRREQEQAIEDLRAKAHEAVCACDAGYFEAATIAELDAYLAAFDRRIRTMFRTRRGLKAARRRMVDERTGQQTLRWAAA